MACRKTNAGAIPGTDLEDTRKDWVTEVVKIFRQALPFRAAPAEKLHKAISSSLREYPHLSSECFGLLRRTIRSAIQGSSVLFPGTKSNTVNVESCSALHNPLQGSAFPVQPKVTVGINPEICSIGKEPVEQVSKGDLQQQMIGLPGSKSSFNSERLEPSDAVIAVAKNSRRGSYNCGKCRRPLKGHNCPFQKVKKVCHSKPEKSKHRKPSGQKKGKRGPYYCADCGLKKKGHICDAVEVKIILDDSSSSMDSKPKTCLPCEVVVHPVTDEVLDRKCFVVVVVVVVVAFCCVECRGTHTFYHFLFHRRRRSLKATKVTGLPTTKMK